MSIRGPLLTVRQGRDGTFVAWLETLGLKEFLQRYPIATLVEWGWLVPQHRVLFPLSEFEKPESPEIQWPPPPRSGVYEQLWASDWYIDSTDEPDWFIHPFFRANDAAGMVLRNNGANWDVIDVPPSAIIEGGETICPYVDYFFHWQGYALIDVIRASDCIEPILNTPDVKERAQGIVRIANSIEDWDPRGFLTASRRWGGYEKLMTWLSHYRAFRDALNAKRLGSTWDADIHKRGCRELAERLGVSPEAFASTIKDDLLRLADHWVGAKGRKKLWGEEAWPKLQQDISYAVAWLCSLTDTKLDDYLEKWSRPAHRQYDGTAELIEVLPFEFFGDRYYFLDMVPHYLKPFNEVLAEKEKLTDAHLKEVVDTLRSANYPFGGFLSSFHQLHDEISVKSADFGRIDFRNRRPLDFYSLLAVRAEGCLMFALRESGKLASINAQERQLYRYIWQLAERRGLSANAVNALRSREARALVQLHAEPKTPIHDVMSWTPAITPREQRLVQAFVCCLLARNYFAHHHYLDGELVKGEESAFMLGGIVFTVLFLLE